MFKTDAHYINPYITYERELEKGPISWNDELKVWFVGDYSSVIELLTNDNLSSVKNRAAKYSPAEQTLLSGLISFYGDWVMFNDPPRHDILKSIGARLIRKNMALLTNSHWYEAPIKAFESKFYRNEIVDFVSDFSKPISQIVFTTLFEINGHNLHEVFSLGERLVQFLGHSEQTFHEAFLVQESLRTIIETIPELEEQAELIQFERNDSIQMQNIRNLIINILFDGYKALSASITTAFYLMIENRDTIIDELSKGLSVEILVEEILRFEPTFQYVSRRVANSFEYKGIRFENGDKIMLCIGSANRDQSFFKNNFHPDPINKHLAFGYGAHYCLGASITRVVLNEIVVKLVKYVENVNLYRVNWEPSIGYRSLSDLKIFSS